MSAYIRAAAACDAEGVKANPVKSVPKELLLSIEPRAWKASNRESTVTAGVPVPKEDADTGAKGPPPTEDSNIPPDELLSEKAATYFRRIGCEQVRARYAELSSSREQARKTRSEEEQLMASIESEEQAAEASRCAAALDKRQAELAAIIAARGEGEAADCSSETETQVPEGGCPRRVHPIDILQKEICDSLIAEREMEVAELDATAGPGWLDKLDMYMNLEKDAWREHSALQRHPPRAADHMAGVREEETPPTDSMEQNNGKEGDEEETSAEHCCGGKSTAQPPAMRPTRSATATAAQGKARPAAAAKKENNVASGTANGGSNNSSTNGNTANSAANRSAAAACNATHEVGHSDGHAGRGPAGGCGEEGNNIAGGTANSGSNNNSTNGNTANSAANRSAAGTKKGKEGEEEETMGCCGGKSTAQPPATRPTRSATATAAQGKARPAAAAKKENNVASGTANSGSSINNNNTATANGAAHRPAGNSSNNTNNASTNNNKNAAASDNQSNSMSPTSAHGGRSLHKEASANVFSTVPSQSSALGTPGMQLAPSVSNIATIPITGDNASHFGNTFNTTMAKPDEQCPNAPLFGLDATQEVFAQTVGESTASEADTRLQQSIPTQKPPKPRPGMPPLPNPINPPSSTMGGFDFPMPAASAPQPLLHRSGVGSFLGNSGFGSDVLSPTGDDVKFFDASGSEKYGSPLAGFDFDATLNGNDTLANAFDEAAPYYDLIENEMYDQAYRKLQDLVRAGASNFVALLGLSSLYGLGGDNWARTTKIDGSLVAQASGAESWLVKRHAERHGGSPAALLGLCELYHCRGSREKELYFASRAAHLGHPLAQLRLASDHLSYLRKRRERNPNLSEDEANDLDKQKKEVLQKLTALSHAHTRVGARAGKYLWVSYRRGELRGNTKAKNIPKTTI
ncbi:hypothetical protein DIPPA_05991 [Diplonema papillatum]|nr:hypothetical protein DIPPA_05991 [Diplonema papillatum]